MSKEKLTMPDFSREKHFSRSATENTPAGLDAIFSTLQRISKQILKDTHSGKNKNILDGAYGRRREEAIRRTLPDVISRYSLTTRTSNLYLTAEAWIQVNTLPTETLENIDGYSSFVLGAAIWLLDVVTDTDAMLKILEQVNWKVDMTLPHFFDIQHDEDVVHAVVYILKHRYATDRYVLDVDPEPGETHDVFLQLLDLINREDIYTILSAVRRMFSSSTDSFYNVEYVLADKTMEAINAYNACVDKYNAHMAVMEKTFQETKLQRKKVPVNPLLVNPVNPLLDAVISTNPFAASPVDKFEQQIIEADRLDKKLSELDKKIHECENNMARFKYDYMNLGFMPYDLYKGHYPDVNLHTPTFELNNPYALCMGILLLCSPSALEHIYADAKGANLTSDLDMPWLFGLFSGMVHDVVLFLPWAMNVYKEEKCEFCSPRKPLSHPSWYKLEYSGKDFKRNLAQIMYELTGTILPRDIDLYDDAHNILRKYGIRGKNETLVVELMSMMYFAQHKTRMPLYIEEEEPEAPNEDVAALKERLNEVRSQLKKVTDEAHELDRRARRAEQTLEQERTQTKADRQELASLREVIFLQENISADESVSVSFPYEVKQRIVIYGGHDSWLKGMKEYLTGDIRYIDKDQAIIDRNLIRNADAVWIQTNAISHRQYYATIDEVRKAGIKVRYFAFASAKKCAEQVATEEM